MSEHDLGLKVGARRLLWSMGYSTRLDVELRGESASRVSSTTGGDDQQPGAGIQSFTDLDVLGVLATPSFRLSTTIADCKSGRRDKPTARMFWARGVADLFGADEVMLVREHEVIDATRQLADRLGITVLPSAELAQLQQVHSHEHAEHEWLEILFDETYVSSYLSAFDDLDKRLKPLLDYREFDFWVYEPRRNLTQLVAHLKSASDFLDPRNPTHLALFADLAWLQLYALTNACAYVRGAFLLDVDRGLQEFLFGGATNLTEKQQVAQLLRASSPGDQSSRTYLPPYYSALRELVVRLIRRPAAVQTALQYAEITSALMAAKRRITLRGVFGDSYAPIPAKLLADVCGFLVNSADLDPAFTIEARAWLLSETLERLTPADSSASIEDSDAPAEELEISQDSPPDETPQS